MEPWDRETIRLSVICGIIAAIGGLLLVIAIGSADAHEATSITGQPLGIQYPAGCCRAATEPGGDCAPISDQYVTEEADGYHINLPIGAHPKLIHKGYTEIIPYSDPSIREPLSNDFHICLNADGEHRYCFFPKLGLT